MALEQTAFAARSDLPTLNGRTFGGPLDTTWTQAPGQPFRVRFSIAGAGTVGGTLEAQAGTAWASVTTGSSAVQSAWSAQYASGTPTQPVLTAQAGFTAGKGFALEAPQAITLAEGHTEIEYCLQLIEADVTSGGTVALRVQGLDTYTRTARLLVRASMLDIVREKVGDTDMSDPLLTDAEVLSHIAAWPTNPDLAAANAAEAISAMYSRGFSFTADGQQFNRSERVNHYTALAQSLRRRGGSVATVGRLVEQAT